MKIAALAFASTFALAIGCAQPVFAQSRDRTGVGNQSYAQGRSDIRDGNATNGSNADEQEGNWSDDSGERGGNDWHHDRGWHGPRTGMGPMMWRRRWMIGQAMGGARFHFARGNARIDIRCPAQGNLQACVHAATQLLDKIAELRRGGDTTTGSATQDDSGQTNGSGLGQQPNAQDGATPGATMPGAAKPQAPRVPGERM